MLTGLRLVDIGYSLSDYHPLLVFLLLVPYSLAKARNFGAPAVWASVSRISYSKMGDLALTWRYGVER